MDYRGLASKLRAMVRNAATREDLTMVLNGTSFRITCAGFQPSEISFLSIRNLLTADHDDPPAETFYIINRDSSELAAFLPETLRIPEGRFIHSSEEGRAALSLEYGFFSLYLSDEHETFIWLCSDKQSPDNFKIGRASCRERV